MDEAERLRLLQELDAEDAAYFAKHGSPVMVDFSDGSSMEYWERADGLQHRRGYTDAQGKSHQLPDLDAEGNEVEPPHANTDG